MWFRGLGRKRADSDYVDVTPSVEADDFDDMDMVADVADTADIPEPPVLPQLPRLPAGVGEPAPEPNGPPQQALADMWDAVAADPLRHQVRNGPHPSPLDAVPVPPEISAPPATIGIGAAPSNSPARPRPAAPPPAAGAAAPAPGPLPVGFLVIIEGPGRGAHFALQEGVSQIGRSADEDVPLAFGDATISYHAHASIAYDAETQAFYVGHGGKKNIVRLNGRPVLATERLSSYDVLRVGETSLLFLALCGDSFDWVDSGGRA